MSVRAKLTLISSFLPLLSRQQICFDRYISGVGKSQFDHAEMSCVFISTAKVVGWAVVCVAVQRTGLKIAEG